MLRSVEWRLFTEVAGQTVGPVFKGQVVQEDSSWIALPLKTLPIGCRETSETSNMRCVTSQKTEHLNYEVLHVQPVCSSLHVFHHLCHLTYNNTT